jgi:hypothetical protein
MICRPFAATISIRLDGDDAMDLSGTTTAGTNRDDPAARTPNRRRHVDSNDRVIP